MSEKAVAFPDCRAFALSDKRIAKYFVQAQYFVILLSGTAHCLRTLYHDFGFFFALVYYGIKLSAWFCNYKSNK